VSSSAQYLNPSEAARQLGVSAKALRLYEERGLVAPIRTAAGWRAYGPDEMNRAAEIVAMRSLGFSLAQIGRVLKGNFCGMEPALAAHQVSLEGRIRQLADTLEKVRELRDDLTRGQTPTTGELTRLLVPLAEVRVAFELPWPWGGERFELRDVRSMNYIIGPLFSGKTRLAQRLAETLPDAVFIGLERLADADAAARAKLDADPALGTRVAQALDWLVEDGAVVSDPLMALIVELEAEGPAILVIDMIEQGLDQATQEALVAHLRHRGSGARPLFCLTRSSAILDLAALGPDEAIIFCPANHSPPIRVVPYPGSPGYEAVATCLASPEVRTRTEGVVAHRPRVA
jgi:DNA-binding transcriptional MerR regulator